MEIVNKYGADALRFVTDINKIKRCEFSDKLSFAQLLSVITLKLGWTFVGFGQLCARLHWNIRGFWILPGNKWTFIKNHHIINYVGSDLFFLKSTFLQIGFIGLCNCTIL